MSRARSSTLPALIALAVGTAACPAQSTVGFQVTHTLPNPFRGVYLVGDLPELGGGDPGAGVRMWPVGPDQYQIDVLLPPDTPYTFQYVERDTQPLLCGPPATIAITQVESAHTPPHAAPPRHKTVWAHSFIPQPILHWRQGDGAFQAVAMRDTAPGRTPGERRWGAGGFATAGREVEFYLTDQSGTLREPPTGAYRASMDACFLQDAELFGYVPAPTVSPLRREYDPMALPTFFSTVLGEDRPYRVVLPRGYDDHPSMRYPVVYAHDGQFWFEPNLIGAPMDPDAAVFASLVREGRVAECILVALDAPSIPHRSRDYIPPGDTGNTGIAGQADRYLDFLISEFKPFIDANYRTLPDRANTLTAGFSYSGACALYCVWDYNSVFSRAGSWSGSFWLQNFRNRVMSEPSRDMRFYMDSGLDNYPGNETLAQNLATRAADPYVHMDDLQYLTVPCLQHLLPDFGARIPQMFEFLLPASERVTLDAFCPPDITTGAVPGQPGYGVPNGSVTNDDFFYFLAQFAAGNLAVCDLTTGAVSNQPGHGVPNGILCNDDFFFYLTLFAAGC